VTRGEPVGFFPGAGVAAGLDEHSLVQLGHGAVVVFVAQHDGEVHVLAQRGEHVVSGRVSWHPGAEVAVEETPGLTIGHRVCPFDAR
jgi:hypothetical protein